MTKNREMIHVFDANGNEIGQTYPKRAHGLIKKGRAHFINDSDTAIVLTDDNNENTEACPPVTYSELCSQSEDIKMFENTVEMNNTAEVLEAVEPAEETVYYDNEEDLCHDGINETTETMSEELRRLYDKLDEIDGELSKLNKYIEVALPDEAFESSEDLRCITSAQNTRLASMVDNWGNIREDTVQMIEAYKKEQKERAQERAPKLSPLETYVRDQIEVVHRQVATNTDWLLGQFREGQMDTAAYEEKLEVIITAADDRVAKLLEMLN